MVYENLSKVSRSVPPSEKFAIGIGIGDLQQDSLARLNRLGEFNIGLSEILPNCFDIYNADTWVDQKEYRGKVWEFLPEEESCVSEVDDWGFHTSDALLRNSKREHFIINSDRIETDFALLIPELNDIYSMAFYCLKWKAKHIKLLSVDEVSTCLAYWK